MAVGRSLDLRPLKRLNALNFHIISDLAASYPTRLPLDCCAVCWRGGSERGGCVAPAPRQSVSLCACWRGGSVSARQPRNQVSPHSHASEICGSWCRPSRAAAPRRRGARPLFRGGGSLSHGSALCSTARASACDRVGAVASSLGRSPSRDGHGAAACGAALALLAPLRRAAALAAAWRLGDRLRQAAARRRLVFGFLCGVASGKSRPSDVGI